MSADGGGAHETRQRVGGPVWRALVVAGGAVLGAAAIGMLWIADISWPLSALDDLVMWVVIPCIGIATCLAAASVRASRGGVLAARVFSLVLWTAATPLVWAATLVLWTGFGSSDWGGALEMAFGALAFATAAWCVTLAPVFAAVIGRFLLVRDNFTSPDPLRAGAVYGKDELSEDTEIDDPDSA